MSIGNGQRHVTARDREHNLGSGVYDRASYDLAIDYQQDHAPPLGASNDAGAKAWLMAQGIRT
jgi:hypothetical protein